MAASPGVANVSVRDDRPDGRSSWIRLAIVLALSTAGGSGIWSVVVALPVVQAEFGAARGDASLAYTLTLIAFGFGGIAMGRLADRTSIVLVNSLGCLLLASGFVLTGLAPHLAAYTLAHGILVGLGASASFAPLVADISLWFVRRRGIAVAICASGNYLAGAVWPTVVQALMERYGWRFTHFSLGVACLILMPPLILGLRRGPNFSAASRAAAGSIFKPVPLAVGPGTLQALLIVAGVACCVAMAMPQVHIVAYCGDLGYGAAEGALMVSLMLGFGIISRVTSGFVADRVGGLMTLLAGSTLQAVALVLYILFDGLWQLYVISAMFGLFQGGIVPSYAIIVREYFPASEAGTRVGLCLTSTLIGMALGGWMSGAIFDLTGSYQAAFLNGLAWNLLNGAIAVFLLLGRRQIEPRTVVA